MQIFVLGMHRSGTSTVSRVLNLMGCYFGESDDEILSSPFNKKGYWERKDVLDLNEKILSDKNSSWCDIKNIINSDCDTSEENKILIARLIKKLDKHRPWFIKDPRLCLTIESWLKFTETPLIIKVIRNPNDVASSLHHRNKFTQNFSKTLWKAYNKKLVDSTVGIPSIVVNYDELIENPIYETNKLYKKLIEYGVNGVRKPSNIEIVNFIDKKLRHNDSKSVLSENEKNTLDSVNGENSQINLSTSEIHEVEKYHEYNKEVTQLKRTIEKLKLEKSKLKIESLEKEEKQKEIIFLTEQLKAKESKENVYSNALRDRNTEVSRLLREITEEVTKNEKNVKQYRIEKKSLVLEIESLKKELEERKNELIIPHSKFLRANKVQRIWRNIYPFSTFNKELKLIYHSKLFDHEFYNSQVKLADLSNRKKAAKHYLIFGGHQLIHPSEGLDISDIIRRYQIDCISGTNPLIIHIRKKYND